MAGQRHPTGYMRRAICDKQKSFSSDLIPLPRPLRRRRVLQQGDYQGNPASWRAQALRAGRTWHEDGHPFGALRGESSWQSLSLCKVLPSVPGTLFFPLIGRRTWNFIGWLPLRQDRRHATITRHFMASSGDENSPRGGEKGEKGVRADSRLPPSRCSRGKTSGGGHFQGPPLFWEKQALLATVFRLTSSWAHGGRSVRAGQRPSNVQLNQASSDADSPSPQEHRGPERIS